MAEDKRARELPSTPRGRPGQALGGTQALGLVGTGVHLLPLLQGQLGKRPSLALCEGPPESGRAWLRTLVLNQTQSTGTGERREEMVQSWQGGPLWAAGRRWSQEQWQEMPSTQQEYTALWQGEGGGRVLFPWCPPYLLLGLDPHVLGPLLAMLAFVRAACLTLSCLQPRGPWSHHLHGWHGATTTL